MLNENTGRRWRGGGKVTNTSDGISRQELQTPAKKQRAPAKSGIWPARPRRHPRRRASRSVADLQRSMRLFLERQWAVGAPKGMQRITTTADRKESPMMILIQAFL